MKTETNGRIEFVKVNGDNPSTKPLMNKYHVRGYPTLIWLDASGNIIDQSSYEKPKEFRDRVQRLLAAHTAS